MINYLKKSIIRELGLSSFKTYALSGAASSNAFYSLGTIDSLKCISLYKNGILTTHPIPDQFKDTHCRLATSPSGKFSVMFTPRYECGKFILFSSDGHGELNVNFMREVESEILAITFLASNSDNINTDVLFCFTQKEIIRYILNNKEQASVSELIYQQEEDTEPIVSISPSGEYFFVSEIEGIALYDIRNGISAVKTGVFERDGLALCLYAAIFNKKEYFMFSEMANELKVMKRVGSQFIIQWERKWENGHVVKVNKISHRGSDCISVILYILEPDRRTIHLIYDITGNNLHEEMIEESSCPSELDVFNKGKSVVYTPGVILEIEDIQPLLN